MTFYQKLDNICKEHKISISHVANAIGLTMSAASKWKNKNSIPRNSTIKKIADYFNMTIYELLYNVDSFSDYCLIADTNNITVLSAQELELIIMFRKLDINNQIRLLNISNELLKSQFNYKKNISG